MAPLPFTRDRLHDNLIFVPWKTNWLNVVLFFASLNRAFAMPRFMLLNASI